MLYGVIRSLLAAGFLALSLIVWRSAYTHSDLAIILLLPLAVVLFSAHRVLLFETHLARRRVVWHDQAWLIRWLSGRISSAFWALVFVTVTIPLLAWQAIELNVSRLPQLALAFLLASSLFVWFRASLRTQLQEPFSRNAAISLATWAVALPFVALVSWQTFYIDTISSELLTAQLRDVPRLAVDGLPRRDGWIAAILSPLYIYDTAKLWLAGQFPQHRWLAVSVSFDTALSGFVMARAAAIVTDFLQVNGIATADDR